MPGTGFEYIDKNYNVTRNPIDQLETALPASQLIDRGTMSGLLEVYHPMVKAMDLEATGAYLCIMIGNLCSAVHYLMGNFDEMADLSLGQLTVQLAKDQGYKGLKLYIQHTRSVKIPTGDEREGWREQYLSTFYGEQIRPVVERMAECSGLTSGHLWGLVASRVLYWFEHWIVIAEVEVLKARLESDHQFMIKGMDPECFGRKKNPFDMKIRKVESPYNPEEQWTLKPTCCMYYRTEGGDYCYTCPRLTDKERNERKAQIREELAAKAEGK